MTCKGLFQKLIGRKGMGILDFTWFNFKYSYDLVSKYFSFKELHEKMGLLVYMGYYQKV